MASDESHADIIAEVRARWQGCEDVSLAELDGRDLLALIDRLKAAHKRELDLCAIIAGASLADVVEEKYKREIEALREALDCVASRIRVFSRDNLNALQCRLIGRALFVAEDALGKLGGRPRKIRPSNP